ncbi:hypothetical protein K2173_021762 [Erythroxylum novogranatense]|uniref:Uncharacterized protein n=1 Tax=Erythroxylum novogranatense TaxID=1862640 RepID=A0AAV8TV46_9ROSI|nr:hypothetical protein K2173_021762 [Erythroxylum novogranatense]
MDPKRPRKVGALAKEAATFRNALLESVRQKSRPVSREFAKLLKDKGLSFGELVKRCSTVSSRQSGGRSTVNQVSTVLGATGMAVLIFTAGIAVWDVFTSDNKLQTATKNAAQVLGVVGGGTLGEFAATALATGLLGAVASPVFVVVAGIVGGFAGSYILGKFAVSLVDKVFGWGDTDTVPNMCDEICMHQCCVAPAPAGNVLARSIARRRDEL